MLNRYYLLYLIIVLNKAFLMKPSIIILVAMALTMLAVQACKKDKEDTAADKSLYNEVTASGNTFYRNGNIVAAAAPSPHGSFKLRFNAIAAAALDSTGELPAGKKFPTGSIIVKDVYNGNTVTLYAVMKKDPSDENAGSAGYGPS
jgi:hypothetical protein